MIIKLTYLTFVFFPCIKSFAAKRYCYYFKKSPFKVIVWVTVVTPQHSELIIVVVSHVAWYHVLQFGKIFSDVG